MAFSQERNPLSIEHQHIAMTYLTETRDALERHVSNLTDIQWNFRTSAQTWSILDVLEHLVLFEIYTHYVICSMQDLAVPDKSEHDPQEVEQFLLRAVPDRSKKFQSPEPGLPAGRWKPSEAVEQFALARARTQQLLEESPYLRGRTVLNPLYSLSDWDGYCWIIAAGLHTARHIMQIEELKNNPRFPEANLITN